MENIGLERGFQPSSGRGDGGWIAPTSADRASRGGPKRRAFISGWERPIHKVANSPVAGSALDGFAVFGPPPRNHGFG